MKLMDFLKAPVLAALAAASRLGAVPEQPKPNFLFILAGKKDAAPASVFPFENVKDIPAGAGVREFVTRDASQGDPGESMDHLAVYTANVKAGAEAPILTKSQSGQQTGWSGKQAGGWNMLARPSPDGLTS
jgi:hypothetical protein